MILQFVIALKEKKEEYRTIYGAIQTCNNKEKGKNVRDAQSPNKVVIEKKEGPLQYYNECVNEKKNVNSKEAKAVKKLS